VTAVALRSATSQVYHRIQTASTGAF
jgi:hypothetical protein